MNDLLEQWQKLNKDIGQAETKFTNLRLSYRQASIRLHELYEARRLLEAKMEARERRITEEGNDVPTR